MLEREVMLQLGFSKPTMRQVRSELEQGTHWKKTETGAVEYTEEGILALESYAGVELVRERPAAVAEEIREATVTPAFRNWGSQHLVSAEMGGKAVFVHIRPGDRLMYAPRMTIKVRRIEGVSEAHWRVVGRPRRRGVI